MTGPSKWQANDEGRASVKSSPPRPFRLKLLGRTLVRVSCRTYQRSAMKYAAPGDV